MRLSTLLATVLSLGVPAVLRAQTPAASAAATVGADSLACDSVRARFAADSTRRPDARPEAEAIVLPRQDDIAWLHHVDVTAHVRVTAAGTVDTTATWFEGRRQLTPRQRAILLRTLAQMHYRPARVGQCAVPAWTGQTFTVN